MRVAVRSPFIYTIFLCGLSFAGTQCAVALNALHEPLGSAPAGIDAAEETPSSAPAETIMIPGPLRPFLRMAGISQQIRPEELMPTLARNVSLYGFHGDRETEYLTLVIRYLQQARDLERMAGQEAMIRVSGCDDAAHLVSVLGYKFERPCRTGDASLITANAERAFLTIDSGFPLPGLEEALETGKPFAYAYPSTPVPILFTEKSWSGISGKRQSSESLLDMILHDRDLARLYTAISNCDSETRSSLLRSPGLKRLMPVAPVFDLYGREIAIRSGIVVLPAGGQKAWADLVGANPHSPGEFVFHLLSKDNGWLASFYDVIARLNEAQQAHFTDVNRLTHLYNAYKSTAPTFNSAFGVFPRNPELLILLTSLKWDANGDIQVPGGIAVWRQILAMKPKVSTHHDSTWRNRCCDRPEALLETLVAASNVESHSGPTQVFLMLEAMNEGRPPERNLSDSTELLVAGKMAQLERWFPIFAEFPSLDDTSIAHFVTAADKVDAISNPALRANALGALQAEIGLWQIFARQHQIPEDKLNASWQGVLQPYTGVSNSIQLFTAARSSLTAIVSAVTGSQSFSEDQVVDLLAGPPQDSQDGQRAHRELAMRIRSVLDDQRLASVDALFGLFDGLSQLAHGEHVEDSILPMAESLRDFEMPRPIFTGTEKVTWAPVVYSARHAELQVRTDLGKLIRSHASPAQLESARAQLAPFLRDTLVGLNYAYYEPPGAQVLHNNPLFVRSHDFSSISVQGLQTVWGDPDLIGVGATAGGGAYLLGSLADLPYALANTEADFIAPKNVQALIWREVVPQLLVASIQPRWWNVTKNELHAAALYQRAGDELLKHAVTDASLRESVMRILADRMSPDQVEQTEHALESAGGAEGLLLRMLPANSFYLAAEMRREHPDQAPQVGPAARELDELARSAPEESDPVRIAKDFGVPHPTIALRASCTLVPMKPVPAYGGIGSGLMAEAWESNNLYWARLADEKGYSAATLNLLAPTLTRRMVVNIFGSNIDDWPALSRAMWETGEEFREGKIGSEGVDVAGRE
ncbi:hypothetical protein DYQ86_20510 [Acidobacteria bacterium AB60]|nr:hypothetical protein DYQ86_20510 [Acidobacteria bacterium AB60]